MARRAGQINEETEYVLKRFGVRAPGYLPNAGTQVKEIEIHEVPSVPGTISVKKAYSMMKNNNVVTLPITSPDNDLQGVITVSDIAESYMEDLNEYLNKDIQVQVFDLDKEKDRLILSARELLREKADEDRKEKISNVEVGLVTEGTVESLQPYGAFINLGNGLSGLVHISQICAKRIKHPSAVLAVGDKVKVKVIAIKDGKLSLSMKALDDVAAEEIQEETIELPETEEVTTTLGSLFKNIKLN